MGCSARRKPMRARAPTQKLLLVLASVLHDASSRPRSARGQLPTRERVQVAFNTKGTTPILLTCVHKFCCR